MLPAGGLRPVLPVSRHQAGGGGLPSYGRGHSQGQISHLRDRSFPIPGVTLNCTVDRTHILVFGLSDQGQEVRVGWCWRAEVGEKEVDPVFRQRHLCSLHYFSEWVQPSSHRGQFNQQVSYKSGGYIVAIIISNCLLRFDTKCFKNKITRCFSH